MNEFMGAAVVIGLFAVVVFVVFWRIRSRGKTTSIVGRAEEAADKIRREYEDWNK